MPQHPSYAGCGVGHVPVVVWGVAGGDEHVQVGHEYIEDEPPTWAEEAPDVVQRLHLVRNRQEREEAAKRNGDQVEASGGQVDVAHVGLDECDSAAGLAQPGGLSARDVQHTGGGVDADDVDACLGDRNGDAACAAAELQDRPAGPPGLLDVEGDVIADVGVDGVVDTGPLVVGGVHMFTRPPSALGRAAPSPRR